ncbi:MAG: MFS transporter [Bacteroidota bacterium]
MSHALFASSFTMILSELPAFLTSLGGEDYKGLIISLFTVTAGVSRPFSGKLADTIGRVPVMVVGTLVCVVCSLMYPFMTTVYGFLLLRFLHGFSTGFKPTATTAYTADIVPAHRRGEAMGILGVSMNTGASASPPIGSWLAMNWSLNVMFVVSSIMGLISVLILLWLKESLKDKQSFQWKFLAVSKDEIVAPEVVPVAVVTAVIYFSFGAMLTIVPDQTVALGMTNKGLYYTSFTACSLLSRLVAGKLSDRVGRQPVLKLSILMMVVSLIFIAHVTSPSGLLIASGCLGFSLGIAAPTVFAWTIDRSSEHRRGVALATTYIALEVGIGTGAMISAWLYDNDANNFCYAFYWMACVTVLGFIYIMFYKPADKFQQPEKAT